MSIQGIAAQFVDACDAGKGWEVCRQWCTADATFACQADALAELGTLEAYVGWAASLVGPMPDCRTDVRFLSVDEERGNACAYAVFEGTHTGEGPVPATGRGVSTDYVYVLEFDGGKIRHMTKIWNDLYALRQLGWA